jgi:hypothetical protein
VGAGDYLVQRAVFAALALLRAQPEAIDDIVGWLATLDPARYAAARQYFASQSTPVILGYPTQPPEQTSAAIAIAVDPATQSFAPIGGSFFDDTEYTPDGTTKVSLTDYYGVHLTTTWNLTVYSYNVDLLLWVADAVVWALQAQKDQLEEQGLANQRVTLQDWIPDQNFGPDPVLRRNVALTAEVVQRYSIGYGTFLKTINLLTIDPESPENPFLDS